MLIYIHFPYRTTQATNIPLKNDVQKGLRSLKLLLDYFGQVISTQVILGFSFGSIMLQTAYIFIGIEGSNTPSSGGSVIVLIGCVVAFIMFVFSVTFSSNTFGMVYDTSLKMSLKAKYNQTLMQDKEFTKFYRSCQVVRVKISSRNFVEKQTSLRCEQVVLEQVVGFQLLVHS